MQVVTYPSHLIDAYLRDVQELLQTGKVAEGRFFRDEQTPFVAGKQSLPVGSGGAAIFSLLAFHKHTANRNVAIVQSNTMRALYTVPKLLGMKPLVVDSSYDDFMSMSPSALDAALAQPGVAASAVVVYSVIGGYLAPSLRQIAEMCRRLDVPLIIDGAHAHYLEGLLTLEDVDIAYSFYATKILPAGEGGLIVTSSAARMAWLRRFTTYDRFSNELDVGLNLRANELTSALMHRMLTDVTLREHFKAARVQIAQGYRSLCHALGVRYLDFERAEDYNGYKFVVLDAYEQVKALGSRLSEHAPTSAVFQTSVLGEPTALPHWCPPTYASLSGNGAR